jgi:adenylylsulfate kinase-like enzyme
LLASCDRLVIQIEILDGDLLRENFTNDLGFSKADRDENIRRIGFVATLLTRNDVIVLVCAISPYVHCLDLIIFIELTLTMC